VKWFNAAGLVIQPDNSGKDVFVHISAVEAGLSNLNEAKVTTKRWRTGANVRGKSQGRLRARLRSTRRYRRFLATNIWFQRR
jgi:cold shock CspA family protein